MIDLYIPEYCSSGVHNAHANQLSQAEFLLATLERINECRLPEMCVTEVSGVVKGPGLDIGIVAPHGTVNLRLYRDRPGLEIVTISVLDPLPSGTPLTIPCQMQEHEALLHLRTLMQFARVWVDQETDTYHWVEIFVPGSVMLLVMTEPSKFRIVDAGNYLRSVCRTF